MKNSKLTAVPNNSKPYVSDCAVAGNLLSFSSAIGKPQTISDNQGKRNKERNNNKGFAWRYCFDLFHFSGGIVANVFGLGEVPLLET